MIVTQSLRIERSHLLQQYATASAEHAEQSDAALTEKLDSYCVYPDIPEQPFSSYKKQDFDKLRKPRILSQLTGLITKDGKKARAEKIIQTALEKIRADMNEDPVKLLEIAVSAIEPLVRMVSFGNIVLMERLTSNEGYSQEVREIVPLSSPVK